MDWVESTSESIASSMKLRWLGARVSRVAVVLHTCRGHILL